MGSTMKERDVVGDGFHYMKERDVAGDGFHYMK